MILDEAVDEGCGNVGLMCWRRELRGVWSQERFQPVGAKPN